MSAKTQPENQLQETTPDTFADQEPSEKDDTISTEPKPNAQMSLHPNDGADNDSKSENSVSEVGSGYENDTNECTEFCIECSTCFGLLDTCCPSSGEGFFTTAAIFCGNILVGCCKCT